MNRSKTVTEIGMLKIKTLDALIISLVEESLEVVLGKFLAKTLNLYLTVISKSVLNYCL